MHPLKVSVQNPAMAAFTVRVIKARATTVTKKALCGLAPLPVTSQNLFSFCPPLHFLHPASKKQPVFSPQRQTTDSPQVSPPGYLLRGILPDSPFDCAPYPTASPLFLTAIVTFYHFPHLPSWLFCLAVELHAVRATGCVCLPPASQEVGFCGLCLTLSVVRKKLPLDHVFYVLEPTGW